MLRAIYDLITSQNNLGIVSYNAREFGDNHDACFVWDGLSGLWLLCLQPKIIDMFGSLVTIEEAVDGLMGEPVERWSDVTVQWIDFFSHELRTESFQGPTAFAFQYEVK
jgi:hypothetical protein